MNQLCFSSHLYVIDHSFYHKNQSFYIIKFVLAKATWTKNFFRLNYVIGPEIIYCWIVFTQNLYTNTRSLACCLAITILTMDKLSSYF